MKGLTDPSLHIFHYFPDKFFPAIRQICISNVFQKMKQFEFVYSMAKWNSFLSFSSQRVGVSLEMERAWSSRKEVRRRIFGLWQGKRAKEGVEENGNQYVKWAAASFTGQEPVWKASRRRLFILFGPLFRVKRGGGKLGKARWKREDPGWTSIQD